MSEEISLIERYARLCGLREPPEKPSLQYRATYLLWELEWAGYDPWAHQRVCPSCEETSPTHREDCALNAILIESIEDPSV